MWYVIVGVISWFVGVWCRSKAGERRLDKCLKDGTFVYKGTIYQVEKGGDR